jgi:hypothetical protein
VLDVERGRDVDAGVEQLLDILEAALVARARGIGVGELVEQEKLRLAGQRGVEVELGNGDAAVQDLLARQDLEAVEQRGGLPAAVGLDQADDDVAPSPSARAPRPAWRRSCPRRPRRRRRS